MIGSKKKERPELALEARNSALRLLTRRDHSRLELVRKLKQRGYETDLIDSIVDPLQANGSLSDARFAEAFVHSRLGRGQGPVRIRQDLYQRGISDDLIDEQLTKNTDFWVAQATAARHKKFSESLPDSRSDWDRQARFLTSRGFPADVIYKVLRR